MQFPLLIVTVHIYRLLTADTIEEKILERAELKLRMDAVVIQSGKASNSKGVDGNQMLAAIRYGADKVFRGDGAAITDDDIDAIINRGKEKTAAMKKVLEEKAQGDMLDFKLEYSTSLQEFGVRKEEKKKRTRLSLSLLFDGTCSTSPLYFYLVSIFSFFFFWTILC